MMRTAPDVIVIGAGAVGLSAAPALQTCGLFPASPGILRKSPVWLLGPPSVRPFYALQMVPWLVRFVRACAPSRVAQSITPQTALKDPSKAEQEPFPVATGTPPARRSEGNLQICDTEAEFRAALPGWQARAGHGITFQHMFPDEMATLQPGPQPRLVGGTLTPGWCSIVDPQLYTLALTARSRALGSQMAQAEVLALPPRHDEVDVVLCGCPKRRAARVALAAGAHSRRIARSLGDWIPQETERGYKTTLPADVSDLRSEVTFGRHGFVISWLSMGLWGGGAAELGGPRLPPNYRRCDAMLKKAQGFVPGQKATGGRQRIGFRPSLPDSLPVTGSARATPRGTYAFWSWPSWPDPIGGFRAAGGRSGDRCPCRHRPDPVFAAAVLRPPRQPPQSMHRQPYLRKRRAARSLISAANPQTRAAKPSFPQSRIGHA